ncbi:MAG: endonuclease/exonuclease/phosphatase family protein [Haloarculaceae archaeon]
MDAVRLVSFNVRYDEPDDGRFDWEGRRDAVASTLRFHRPDVVGLQEPLAHQYEDVRDALDGFDWVGRSRRAATREGEFCPVGYRTDRISRLDSGTFWLSETPDDPGSVGWDAALPRIATWARLRDERSGERFCYVNTHFDHTSARARRESARLLLERLPGLRDGLPVVLAGDFNCTAGERPHAILAGTDEGDSPLIDAREASAHPWHGPETTRTDFESLDLGRAIDHAFVDGLAVRQVGVATDQFGDGWYPSDHLPLVVDFGVE